MRDHIQSILIKKGHARQCCTQGIAGTKREPWAWATGRGRPVLLPITRRSDDEEIIGERALPRLGGTTAKLTGVAPSPATLLVDAAAAEAADEELPAAIALAVALDGADGGSRCEMVRGGGATVTARPESTAAAGTGISLDSPALDGTIRPPSRVAGTSEVSAALEGATVAATVSPAGGPEVVTLLCRRPASQGCCSARRAVMRRRGSFSKSERTKSRPSALHADHTL